MNMIDIHDKELGEVSEAFHNFLSYYKKDANIVYGFIEGNEDLSFYGTVIGNKLPSSWSIKLIESGNKDSVIRTYSYFNWNQYSIKRICFFIDRDLSEILNEKIITGDNIYITDGYSIENSIVSFELMQRTLHEILGVGPLKAAQEKLLEEYYTSAMDFFKESMLPLMAQIIIWYRNKKQPCLNNIGLKKIYKFSGKKPELQLKYEEIESRIKYIAKCVRIEQSEIQHIENVIEELKSRYDIEKVIRGKYLFCFFVSLSLMIHRLLPELIPQFPKPKKMKITFGEGNAMIVLGSKGRCPDTLSCFLDNTFLEYIKGERIY